MKNFLPIDRRFFRPLLSTDLSCWADLSPGLLSLSLDVLLFIFGSLKMPGLSDFKPILLANEQEYRESKGSDRQGVVEDIMKSMVAQSQGTLDKIFLKGLDAVSSQIWTMYRS